jgi:hypothetical protein
MLLSHVLVPLDKWAFAHHDQVMKTSASQLLDEIDAFLVKHEMTATTFGLLSSNDGHLIRDMRGGRQITLGRADRIRAFMSAYRPAGRPRRRSKSQGVAA